MVELCVGERLALVARGLRESRFWSECRPPFPPAVAHRLLLSALSTAIAWRDCTCSVKSARSIDQGAKRFEAGRAAALRMLNLPALIFSSSSALGGVDTAGRGRRFFRSSTVRTIPRVWPPQCNYGLAPRCFWTCGFTLSVERNASSSHGSAAESHVPMQPIYARYSRGRRPPP